MFIQWYHVAVILLHRPLIPRFRAGQVFISNAHHKKATDHANQLVDLLAQFAAGQEIDKVRHPCNFYENLGTFTHRLF